MGGVRAKTHIQKQNSRFSVIFFKTCLLQIRDEGRKFKVRSWHYFFLLWSIVSYWFHEQEKMWKHKIGQELKAVFIFVVISKIMKTILNRRKSGKILDHEKITKNKINGKNLKSNFDVAIFESLIDFRCKHACNLHACQSI